MAYARQRITKTKTRKVTFNKKKKKGQKHCPSCGKFM